MSFSGRSAVERSWNALSMHRAQLEARGEALVDLTDSNPTRCGLSREVRWPQVATYEPEAFGSWAAREVLASTLELTPERLVLAASTSEAFGWLLALLCDAGQAMLVPQPSYPLFEELARPRDVRLERYALQFVNGHWAMDVEALRAAPSDVRALVIVSPANPTGHRPTVGELEQARALCAERGWALIIDEVFHDVSRHGPLIASAPSSCLTFSLGGLSKFAGLPQAKLGWLSVSGPPALVEEALLRLESLADASLSVSSVVQTALPEILAGSAAWRAQVQTRVASNWKRLSEACKSNASLSVLPVDGGWSALLRLPERFEEEAVCLRALDAGVVVNPGGFFDMPRGKWLVVSLLPEPGVLARGVERLVSVLATERLGE